MVTSGVPVGGVVVGSEVLIMNKSGVLLGCSEKGVAVGCGDARNAGVAV